MLAFWKSCPLNLFCTSSARLLFGSIFGYPLADISVQQKVILWLVVFLVVVYWSFCYD